MFTLAHELAHVWLGKSGLSGDGAVLPVDNKVETFCNKAAAEFLIPASSFGEVWAEVRAAEEPFEAIAHRYKVSPIVAARRALDLQFINRNAFFEFYEDQQRRERKARSRKSGGDFYRNQNSRVGEFFGREVVRAAKEGRLLYRDAYALTGLYGRTFDKYAEHLGFNI